MPPTAKPTPLGRTPAIPRGMNTTAITARTTITRFVKGLIGFRKPQLPEVGAAGADANSVFPGCGFHGACCG